MITLLVSFLLGAFSFSASSPLRLPSNDGAPVPAGSAELHNAVVNFKYQGKTFCSGFLDQNKKVVTAAHCFDSLNSGMMKLENIEVENKSGIRVNSSSLTKIFIAKSYSRSQGLGIGDIAVVELEEGLPKEHSIQMLSAQDPLSDKDSFTLAAFGWNPDMNEKNFEAGTLRQASIDIDSIDSNGTLVSNHKKGQLVCSADSGGPLFVIRNGALFHAGVVSGTSSESSGERGSELTPEQLEFIQSLPAPEKMTKDERISAMRKMCNFSGRDFWTSTQRNLNFIRHPSQEGLALETTSKAMLVPSKATSGAR